MAAAFGLLRPQLAAISAARCRSSVSLVNTRLVTPMLKSSSLLPDVRMFAGKSLQKKAPEVEPEIVPEYPDDDDGDFDPMAGLTAGVQRRVLALKKVQTKADELAKQFAIDQAKLQAEYMMKFGPLWDERKSIVTGEANVDNFDVPDDGSKDEGKIPEFWLTALRNTDRIGAYITERDAEVLKYLEDIRVEVLTGEDRGFKLLFHFAPNPYLRNKVLEKTYELEADVEVVPKRFLGCPLEWTNPSMDPTVEQIKKRVKEAKGAKGAKPTFTTESQPCESFFNFFDPPAIPDSPDAMADDEMDSLQEELSTDYEIGVTIKDSVIPRAVEWFTGELAGLGDEDYEEFEDDYPEEEEEEEPEPMRRGNYNNYNDNNKFNNNNKNNKNNNNNDNRRR
ncbi:nucleosome assembly protein-domain-containing protein [Haematococcus lacustris]